MQQYSSASAWKRYFPADPETAVREEKDSAGFDKLHFSYTKKQKNMTFDM